MIENLKAEKEKFIKEQKETKKKIDGLENKKEKQHDEITKLRRENGLLEELNRNMSDLNKALEFPYTVKQERSNKNDRTVYGSNHHREEEKTLMAAKKKEECRNGPSCAYLRRGRCYYVHSENTKKVKCRNGSSCQYMKENRCWFEHK